jgi:hypothetical protein
MNRYSRNKIEKKLNFSQHPNSHIKVITWTGGMTQAVEYQPSKHRALSSNPSNAKSKKM